MTDILVSKTPSGEEFVTPFRDCGTNQYGSYEQQYRIVASKTEDGMMDIRLQMKQGFTAIGYLDLLSPGASAAASELMEAYGSQIFDLLYGINSALRLREKAYFDDWFSLPAHRARDRWKARNDASRYGLIFPGDYVITRKTVDKHGRPLKHGRLLQWGRSSWRNQICFIDPADPSPSSVGQVSFDSYRPRRLSATSLAEADDLDGGEFSSSAGHWSAHEVFDMIASNQAQPPARDREFTQAFGFD